MSIADRRPAYVELVFRLHEDGRREQFARQVDELPDGTLVPHDGRPGGPLAARALSEALSQGLVRRVAADPRAGGARVERRRRL